MLLGQRMVVVKCREPSDSDCYASQIVCLVEILQI